MSIKRYVFLLLLIARGVAGQCVTSPCTFTIAAVGDDGFDYGAPVANYNAVVCTQAFPTPGSTTYAYAARYRQGNGSYGINTALFRWATSLPAGTVASSAYLVAHLTSPVGNPDGRNLVCDWETWSVPMSCTDWTFNAPTTNLAVVDSLSNYLANSTTNIPTFGSLTNLQNINSNGYTYLRCSIDGGVPSATNVIAFETFDGNPANALELVVAFGTPTPVLSPTPVVTATPTPTPTLAFTPTARTTFTPNSCRYVP